MEEGGASKDWAVILEVPLDRAVELADQLSLTYQGSGEQYLIVLVQVVAPTADEAALLIADKAPGVRVYSVRDWGTFAEGLPY